MITAGILAGAGIGLGLLLVARGLVPRREPLADALIRLLDPARSPTPLSSGPDGGPPGWKTVLGGRLATSMGAAGADLDRLGRDLRVVGRTVEEHLVEKASGAVAGAILPGAATGLMRLGGVNAPLSMVAVATVALAGVGFLLPDLLLRGQAEDRRRDFRYALSSYLDLAHIVLAAGAGVETALTHAAEAGEGWAFAELRAALHRSRLTGESPWSALQRLGEELDITDLREVASSLALAGAHGAKVRESLEARAAALRARDLAEMEGDAEAATERMAVPSVLMVVGFVLFVGYPAVDTILGF